MIIKTKYNLGDKVLIRKNRIDGNPPDYLDGEIVMIYFYANNNAQSIRYRVQYKGYGDEMLSSDVLEDALIEMQEH